MATLADLQSQRQKFFKQKSQQAQGQIAGQTQGDVEALQRRFTSMGGANTGAALSAEQKARETGLAQQRQAQADIAGQELQVGEADLARAAQSEEAAKGREFAGQQARLGEQFTGEQARLGREAQIGESALGRQFAAEQARLGIEAQRGESEASRGFAGEQARLAREAALGESQAGRQFTAEQADLARRAQLGESEAARELQRSLAQQDIGFKRELAATEQGNKLKEMDLAYQQFLIDKDTTAFNKRLSAIQAGIDPNTVGAMEGTTGAFQTIAQTEAEKARQAEQKRAETLRPSVQNIRNPNIDTTTEYFTVTERGSGRSVNTKKVKNPNYVAPTAGMTNQQALDYLDAQEQQRRWANIGGE